MRDWPQNEQQLIHNKRMQLQKTSSLNSPNPSSKIPHLNLFPLFSHPNPSPSPSPSTPKQQQLLTQQKFQTPCPSPSLCNRCNESKPAFCCRQCEARLCGLCDRLVHGCGKFVRHLRIGLGEQKQVYGEQGLDEQDSESMRYNSSKCAGLKLGLGLNLSLKQGILTINITQKWNKIIAEVEDRFQELAALMKEKREDVIGKLEKKREEELRLSMEYPKELNSLRKSSEENTTKKSQMSQKLDTPSKPKPLECEHSDQQGRCLGKYQLNSLAFQQLKQTIQKLQFRTAITRTLCPSEQQYKKKMRNSMLLNLNTTPTSTPYTSVFSSGLRSPKNSKLSQSIWVEQREKQRQNQEEMDTIKQTKSITGDLKLLTKVKSQKVILKSKGMDLTMVSPRRQTNTRLKKLEIMI